jgi:DNA-3-methyladenine glycosylase
VSGLEAFVPLDRKFYLPSAAIVAPKLLGHWLIRTTPQGICGGPIVETEAYLRGDPACHAFRGKTQRNAVMFEEPGHAYVYFIYGCHFCVNAVCLPAEIAEAVLIRAIEPLFGADLMRKNRPRGKESDLTRGPAKLCQALAIARTQNGSDLCDRNSPLMIAKNPRAAHWRRSMGGVQISRRIGLNVAVELPLRFYLAKSAFVSGRVQAVASERRSA